MIECLLVLIRMQLNLPNGKKRRPMILERSVETMDSLLPYLSNFATLAYDSTVAGGKIDMDFLERVVEADMIEVRGGKEAAQWLWMMGVVDRRAPWASRLLTLE